MKDTNDLVSIILPAYNVQDYIRECLDSIVSQTYRNIEVIVVDDGSSDNTGMIVKEFCQKHNNVRYFIQTNQGSGPARNRGIDACNGSYVIFVDPDDWIADNLVECLVTAQRENDYDLVCCGHVDVLYEKGSEVKRITRSPKMQTFLSQKECRAHYAELLLCELLAPPTRKLFKTSIIRENYVRFPSLRRSQDIPFNYRYYDCIHTFKIIEDACYFYRIMGQSDYVLKLKSDYYLTIVFLFSELSDLHIQWGYDVSSSQYDMLLDYFENLVMLNIEADVVRGNSIVPIIQDEVIEKIISLSRPSKLFNRMMKAMIVNKHYALLKSLVRLRVSLRLVKRRIGK